MLVLSRKTQERIHIGNDITITIVRVKGNTVRVGIEAPSDVRILRGELPPKELLEVASSDEPVGQPTAAEVTLESVPAEEAVEEGEPDCSEYSESSTRAHSLRQILAARKRAWAAAAGATV